MKKRLSDEQIIERAKEAFDNEAQSYDAATRSKLNQARQKALGELGSGKSGNRIWLPAAGATACAVFAVALFVNRADVAPELPDVPGSASTAEVDFEILLADESLEMFEDLEFFEVLELLDEIDNGSESIG